MGRAVAALSILLAQLAGQTPEACCSVAVQVLRESGAPVEGASVQVSSGAIRYDLKTRADGGVSLELRAPGRYLARVAAGGLLSAARQFDIVRDQKIEIGFVLPEAGERRESVTVTAEAERASTTASGAVLESLPQRITDVSGALPLLPDVVRTPEGRLRLAGAPEYRSTFLINGTDVTDPATGSFGPGVPIDIVEQLQVWKSPFLAEYGQFSAAVVAVTTRRGGDKWHFELNDPTPELRIRSARITGVRGFTPRFAATGPVLREKLFFSGAGAFELRKRPVYPLPFPRNEEKEQGVNAYVQADWIVSPTHLLSASAHGVPKRFNYTGLGFYTPQSAAPALRTHRYRATVSDHLQWTGGTLLDSALSASEDRDRTWGQGSETMVLLPAETLGNYPFRSDRTSRRVQWSETLTLPLMRSFGTHEVKTGLSAAHTRLDGEMAGTGALLIPAAGFTDFGGMQRFQLSDTALSAFAQDGWEPRRNLRLDIGMRSDWQRISGLMRAAPRFGAAWMPGGEVRTVLRAGYGWFYDRVPLLAYAWHAFPERDGTPGRLASRAIAPRSRNFSLSADQPLGRRLLLHAGWTESRSSGLLVVQPGLRTFTLASNGRARTRTADVMARITLYPEQEWVVSYVHTRGTGNLNTFPDVALQPLIRADLYAAQPGIVPHRFLTWGVFPLPFGLRLSPYIERRNGFPYSALDVLQQYAGPPNSRRLPGFFSLDGRVSKDIAWKGHKVRLSFAMFNITDHANFDAVRWNTADPQFGEFLGRRPRRFRLDFDWLF